MAKSKIEGIIRAALEQAGYKIVKEATVLPSWSQGTSEFRYLGVRKSDKDRAVVEIHTDAEDWYNAVEDEDSVQGDGDAG